MDRSYTSAENSQLVRLQGNLSALTKSRLPHIFSKLHQSKRPKEIQQFSEHATRNRLFAAMESFVNELVESRPLLTTEFCSVCEKYDWTIPMEADDLRAQHRRRKEDTILLGNTQPVPVWKAEKLPSGSLFQILSRPACRVCMLVVHLFSPLPIKSFLSWALDQPLATLHGFQYSMSYRDGRKIGVWRKLPLSDLWQMAGTIEMVEIDKHESQEQSLVWKSSKLSKNRLLNSSWVRSSNVDYELIESWLHHCDSRHERCQHNETELHGWAGVKIRLIDVHEQRIVHGNLAYPFFALSYVWGGVDRLRATVGNIAALEQAGSLRDRAASIPRTVHDAMKLVAHLGQRYLWVDSLCIVQDDKADKHDQISMMHEIYAAAYCTIVQHSGRDANAGLPGIRPGSRSPLATKIHVGNDILIATANYATPGVLTSSIHSTRGWTHQEVLLSTRCLHFFDKQLTFVCKEEWAQDWNASVTLEDEGERDHERSKHSTSDRSHYSAEELQKLEKQKRVHGSARTAELTLVPALVLWQINPISSYWGFKELTKSDSADLAWLRYFEIFARILTEYTSRSLSFESDTLAAFQGLEGAIRKDHDIRFYYGLPSVSFDHALLWVNLGSGGKRQCNPEQPFPSWSWAAWAGQSTYNFCELGQKTTWSVDPLNSYIRAFYIVIKGCSFEIPREKFSRAKYNIAQRTQYFEAREQTSEPPSDRLQAAKWPDGCLHFWAEECCMDQLTVLILKDILILRTSTSDESSSDKRCGIISLPSNLRNAESLSQLHHPDYSLILMSETPQRISRWSFGPTGALTESRTAQSAVNEFDFEYSYYREQQLTRTWMFNVLLVKRNGLFVERIGFGQMHMFGWLSLRRRRRYIRML
ncbi:heterokaryon incompatibility protein-domain-containing protein [Clohesyomyces aquaticus]|uniref:Heterokaryon incompatibility protein-domain-containing protein n=1 Tax=Clohesyomyces aquaticus TaxID=1231657 RepID=A0A1Y1ZIA4_9PLEO|nr:heterokaryon incompatibility protein-domain-containing protein [Clohesyomyces aquaticus]